MRETTNLFRKREGQQTDLMTLTIKEYWYLQNIMGGCRLDSPDSG
jgi:hypothetical protein